MNCKKAKKLRRLIYKGEDFRNRQYGVIKDSGQIATVENDNKNASKRRIYQKLKKLS